MRFKYPRGDYYSVHQALRCVTDTFGTNVFNFTDAFSLFYRVVRYVSNAVIHNVIRSQSFKEPYVFVFPAVQINHVGKYECVYDVVAMPLELKCLSKPTHFTVMRMSYIELTCFILSTLSLF